MLGNHRDAWVYGAADASSGTAALVEVARVLGEQLKKGVFPEGRGGAVHNWSGGVGNVGII